MAGRRTGFIPAAARQSRFANMPTDRRERFTVLDTFWLVAAIALGLAWMKNFQDYEAGGESYPFEEFYPPWLFRLGRASFVW